MTGQWGKPPQGGIFHRPVHQFPRVQLQSSDDSWQLAMGPARVDAIWRNVPDSTTAHLENLVADCAQSPQRYVEAIGVSVSRLALVVQRFCPTPDPANTLIERFCDARRRQEPFNRSAAFEIHKHRVYRPQQPEIDYSINSWVRCKSASLVADKRPAIAVEQDLNTLVEEAELRL